MKGGLGRGLASLLDDVEAGQSSVGINLIDPNKFQPRRVFDEDAIASLSESIAQKGVIQPIIVRTKLDGRYELIAGERRLRAAKRAGLNEIPVVVKEMSDEDSLEIAILENIQREGLNPIEEAEGYARLMNEFSHTQEDIAKFTGKSRSYIANSLRLLNLPEFSRSMLESGKITVGHAKLALSSESPDELVRSILEDGLTVRQTEKRISVAKPGNRKSVTSTSKERNADPEIVRLEERISDILGAKANIELDTNGGRIVVSFNDLAHLDGILKKMIKSDV